jgi:ParB family chromosome partitioning protein
MVSEYLAPNTAAPEQTALILPLASIDTSPLNPRKHFDEQDLQRLADSLEADGLLQPIVVTPTGDRFVVVAGERRLRAARLLNWTDIPAIVRTHVDDRTLIRLALLENLARTDLDPLEEAEGYRALQDLGMTQVEIAAAVHRSQPAIANAIRLLKAPDAVQARLQAREISPSHVLALLRYEAFPEALVKIAEVAVERRTPTKELEKKELGWEFTAPLKEAKLAVEVSRGAFDWRTVCVERCPFGAFQAEGYYGGLCLKPEHFRELHKTATAARKAEVQEQLAAAAGPDGKPALKLSSLHYGQYERMDWGGTPRGCSPKCECRRTALDGGTRPIQVCVDPKRFKRLKEDQRQQEEASKKARQKQLADACGQALDQVDQVRSRELVVLATHLCSNLDARRFNQLLAKHAPGMNAKDADFDDFLELEPLQLVKIATEALLSKDLEQVQWSGKAEYAAWYAGQVSAKRAKRSRKAVAVAETTEVSVVDDLAGQQPDQAGP